MFALFLFILTPFCCLAAGKHEPSIADLIWPAISFTTLFSLILFKLKKPIGTILNKRADDVMDLFNTANARKKESRLRLDESKNKLLGLEADRQKIKDSFKKAAQDYSEKIVVETKQQIGRLEIETQSIIEHEKKKQISKIDELFVEEIIEAAKTNISQNKKLKSAASERLLQQVN